LSNYDTFESKRIGDKTVRMMLDNNLNVLDHI
jgi:hypothetical protein